MYLVHGAAGLSDYLPVCIVCVSGSIKQLSVTEKACSRLQVLGAIDLGGFDGCDLDIVQTANFVVPLQCFP